MAPTSAAKRDSSSLSKAASPAPKRPRTNKNDDTPRTELKFKSPAEFFAENKNIAGFDNPGKSLYTTIRELVENALDAAEAVHTLPDISVTVERIDRAAFHQLVGISSRDRVDVSLYKDVENDRERRLRQARERRDAKRRSNAASNDNTTPNAAADQSHQLMPSSDAAAAAAAASATADGGANADTSTAPTERRRAGGNEIFRVTVSDNGSGMPHDDVPNMMGRVLAGTKYCVRQARGKFGLGSKMALIWSKMSTGLPVHVRTAMRASSSVTNCVLDIDIARNQPTVLKHTRTTNTDGWRGSHVSVTIEGNWTTYRAKILLYMRQMAVITPYARFGFKFVNGRGLADASKDFELAFARRTEHMPSLAKEVKHHPSSVNQLILKQIIGDISPKTSLVDFLSKQFVAIPRSYALRLITELGTSFTSHKAVKDLSLNDIRQIDALLHEARFEAPKGDCLSPAGEYNLRLGIMKELRPDMVATHAEAADVFEGHPFIVEAGVALGGKGMKPGINVFRFANRIPLLFEAGNDVVTKTAREAIRWSNYKINVTTDRIGVICSIVSTKIPFKGTGKEYIGDDPESIKAAVKRAITQCCSQLRTKLVRHAAQRDAAQRKKNITRYAPNVAAAIVAVFKDLEDPEEGTVDVRDGVVSGRMNKDVLLKKLMEHVQQVDKEQAIEYAASTGRGDQTLETFYIARRAPEKKYSFLQFADIKVPPTAPTAAGGPLNLALLSNLRQ